MNKEGIKVHGVRLKGHRSRPEEVPCGQIWDDLNIEKNNANTQKFISAVV